jgi:IrrE N-terminal-like domain
MSAAGGQDWPHLGLRQLPDLDVLRSLIRKVRATVMGDPESREALDVDRLCELGGFDVEEMSLHGAEGRLQALIFPSEENRFCVYVDPEPPGGWAQMEPRLQAELREHRLRFRICHEVAHSFFFDRDGDLPTAIVGGSAAQEEICDRFASELLIPRGEVRDLRPQASSVVEIQRRFRVSLEAAARAFADVHDDFLVALFVDDPALGNLQWSNCPEHADALCRTGHSRATLDWRRQTVLVGPSGSTARPVCSLGDTASAAL